MTVPFNPVKIQADLDWMKDHPWFDEKPATIEEFLGPGYLNIAAKVRKPIRDELVKIFGTEVSGYRMALFSRGIITGAIGIGKTTFASIVLPYMAHWVLCLKDPQDFFKLLPGTRIAFMMMSTSENQAKEVLFGDVIARIEHSIWFRSRYPKDPNFKNTIRFPKEVHIIPGDSSETTFEGYNILGGVQDEIDSYKVTPNKDYALEGYNTINSRIESRFGELGYLLLIGQMKKAQGFAADKFVEFGDDPTAHRRRMAIWESFGWDKYLKPNGERDSFWYDIKRKRIVTAEIAGIVQGEHIIEVPTTYRKSFENDPSKALRDLAGIPPEVGDPFITLTDRIEAARDKWIQSHRMANGMPSGQPVNSDPVRPQFAQWFKAGETLRRAVHLDIAYSAEGDAASIVMGHISKLVEVDDEEKPYITIDMMMRFRAAPGTEIMISDLRRVVYDLKEKLNFNVKIVTMDGFQSKETEQQLKKKRFRAEYLSVDRSIMPYHDLREAIYEERIEWPPYVTYLRKGDSKPVDIVYREASQLTDTGRKIDHPKGGSKDVTDGLAGVVTTLMGDRTYRRGVVSSGARTASSTRPEGSMEPQGSNGLQGPGLSVPVPPRIPLGNLDGLIPPHLRR